MGRTRRETGSGLPRPDDHRRHLLGLAGLAAVAVTLSAFAVPGVQGGAAGLECLFVLGGFGLAEAAMAARSGRGSVGSLVGRGIVRWGPQLVAVVAFAVVWAYVQDGELAGRVGGAALTVLGQVYDIARAGGRVDGRAFDHLWSVSLVAQYAVVMIALLMLVRPGRRAAWWFVGVGAFVASARFAWVESGAAVPTTRLLPWFHLDALLIGSAVAVLHRHRLVISERRRLYAASGPALVVLFVSFAAPGPLAGDRASLLVGGPIAVVAAAVVVLAIATRAASPGVRRPLGFRPLGFLGRRAGELYLWHAVVGVWLLGSGRHEWDGGWLLARQLGATAVAAFAAHEFLQVSARPTRPSASTPSVADPTAAVTEPSDSEVAHVG